MNVIEVKKRFPEYKKILEMSGGYKPRKFVQAIEVIKCPAKFDPSGLSDAAYRNYYFVKDGVITKGGGYSYDTMMSSGVVPRERMVDVPKGTRMWVVTYDGMWGGFWEVKVFVHELDMLEAPKSKLENIFDKSFDPISKKIDALRMKIENKMDTGLITEDEARMLYDRLEKIEQKRNKLSK